MTVRLPYEDEHRNMTVSKFLKTTVEDKAFREILYYSEETIDSKTMMMYFKITGHDEKVYIKENFPETLI